MIDRYIFFPNLYNFNKRISLIDSKRKLIGVEMEIFRMYYSATNSSDLKPTFLVAKSICDYANNEKSDDFQEYVVKTSAAYIKYLICENMILPLNS